MARFAKCLRVSCWKVGSRSSLRFPTNRTEPPYLLSWTLDLPLVPSDTLGLGPSPSPCLSSVSSVWDRPPTPSPLTTRTSDEHRDLRALPAPGQRKVRSPRFFCSSSS